MSTRTAVVIVCDYPGCGDEYVGCGHDDEMTRMPSTALPDEFITDARRRFGDDPSTRTLIDLLHDAYRAGWESALPTEQWRIVAVHPRTKAQIVNDNAREEWEARALLKVACKFDPVARLERRRVGATEWEVADAD